MNKLISFISQGPPEINCNYDEVVIRLPNSSLEMECEVSSDFLSLHSPTLYWDDEPISEWVSLLLLLLLTK